MLIILSSILPIMWLLAFYELDKRVEQLEEVEQLKNILRSR